MHCTFVLPELLLRSYTFIITTQSTFLSGFQRTQRKMPSFNSDNGKSTMAVSKLFASLKSTWTPVVISLLGTLIWLVGLSIIVLSFLNNFDPSVRNHLHIAGFILFPVGCMLFIFGCLQFHILMKMRRKGEKISKRSISCSWKRWVCSIKPAPDFTRRLSDIAGALPLHRSQIRKLQRLADATSNTPELGNEALISSDPEKPAAEPELKRSGDVPAPSETYPVATDDETMDTVDETSIQLPPKQAMPRKSSLVTESRESEEYKLRLASIHVRFAVAKERTGGN